MHRCHAARCTSSLPVKSREAHRQSCLNTSCRSLFSMATRPSSGGGNDAIASAAACWTACWLRLGLTRLANAPANWISLTRTYSCGEITSVCVRSALQVVICCKSDGWPWYLEGLCGHALQLWRKADPFLLSHTTSRTALGISTPPFQTKSQSCRRSLTVSQQVLEEHPCIAIRCGQAQATGPRRK